LGVIFKLAPSEKMKAPFLNPKGALGPFFKNPRSNTEFQPNLARNLLGGWGFIFVQIKGLVPFGAQ